MADRVWIWFAENGHIRKWDSKPFAEGTEYVASLSPEQPEKPEAAETGEPEISPYEFMAREFDRLAILRKMWSAGEVAAILRRHDIERAASPVSDGEARRKALIADLLREIDRNVCTHEETVRGGTIWTICTGCNRKWADDAGGFKPHEDSPAVKAAREYLRTLAAIPTAGDVK